MIRIVAVAAALAAAGVALPAHATYQQTGGGLTCGLAVTPDSSGDRSPTGTVTGGPWAAPYGHPDSLVQVKCIVELVRPFEPPQIVAEAQSAVSPTLAYLPPTLLPIPAPAPGANIALCTEVTVYTDGMPYVYYGDADHNPTNGAQCAPGPKGDQAADVFVIPPEPGGGEICASVQHDYYPPVPRGACPPVGI